MATPITDEMMQAMLSKTRSYTLLIIYGTEKLKEPGAEKIIWEHGRRNFQLRAASLLSIVCPIRDESGMSGIGIFNATPEETKKIYEDDPAVKAGLLTFEVHPCTGFPGDSLPE